MSDKISRGDFLLKSGLAAAGVMMGGLASAAPTAQKAEDKKKRFAKLGKVNVAWVGMANRGREVMREFVVLSFSNCGSQADCFRIT